MDAQHALKVWIEKNTTQAKFAEEVGISEGYLSEILKGIKEPKLGLANKMSRATKGKVPLSAFVQSEAAQ